MIWAVDTSAHSNSYTLGVQSDLEASARTMSGDSQEATGGIEHTIEWILIGELRRSSGSFSPPGAVGHTGSTRTLKLRNAINDLELQIRRTFTILRFDLLLYLQDEDKDDVAKARIYEESRQGNSDQGTEDASSQSSTEPHLEDYSSDCLPHGFSTTQPSVGEARSRLEQLCELLEARVNPNLSISGQRDNGSAKYPRLAQLITTIKTLYTPPATVDLIPTAGSKPKPFLFNIAEDESTAKAFVAFTDPSQKRPPRETRNQMTAVAEEMAQFFLSFNSFVDALQMSAGSLDAQESTNLADKDGQTPLHLAATDGNETMVQWLLEKGVPDSINLADKDGKTSLHLAAEAGHNGVVELLLAQIAVDLNLKDANGRTPLSWAAVHHHDDVVSTLVAKHITMNPDGSGLFQQVLADCHENVVKLLLTEYFDNVARGSYSWLSDLRKLGFVEADIMDLVMEATADIGGPWISANISNLPDPEATIDTALHQSYCAHKRRNRSTGDHKEKNETVRFDRFSEYISREDMQRRVSFFCGLAGVLPPGSGPLGDFGLIRFLDTRGSIEVIYRDHWVEPQPRNEDAANEDTEDEDAEDRLRRLTFRMRAKAKETATAVQSTPPYSRLISQLQGALRGFINAAITLQRTGFCCDQFTVLTAPESTPGPDNVTIVHMNTIRFDVVLEIARDMGQLQHEGLDDSALFRSVSTRLIGIMETLFQTPLSLPSTIAHQLHLCSLTVQLLCLGIVFYAQAHAGKLHPSYLAEPLTKVEILGSSLDQPYIIAEQAKLACMGELVGDQVFVFRMSTRTLPIGVDGSFLSATCEEIVDSWGPASLIMDPQEASERILGLVIRGGIIQPNGKSDDGIRLFHWTIDFGGTEPSPSDAIGYKDKIVVGATIPAPSSHLVTQQEIPRTGHNSPDIRQHSSMGERAAVLDANRSRAATQQSPETHPPPPQAQHAVQTPVTITKCPRDITESYNASRAFHLDELGSKPSRWRFTTLTANLQGGYQVLAQVGGEWQKQSAVPMKRVFLDHWGIERKLSDFESPLGLQISLCTGVARRVPLRVLVREDLMNYVDSIHVKGWKDLKEKAKGAMESKERFAKWSDELTDEQRTCVQNVFWHVLNRLKDTGFDEDGDQFSILWPYKSDANRCVKVKPRHDHQWLTVLEDKEWSATFAVATNLCLATTKHRCRGERNALWPGVKTLSTSMWLLQPRSDGNHSVVEQQIENEGWYWNGEKNSRTWFSAQKSQGAIAELEFKNSRKDLATFATRQIPEALRRRVLQRLWDKMHSRGVLVEANDAHHDGEKVFIRV